MTERDAIRILCGIHGSDKEREAIGEAIKALRKQLPKPTFQYRCGNCDNDIGEILGCCSYELEASDCFCPVCGQRYAEHHDDLFDRPRFEDYGSLDEFFSRITVTITDDSFIQGEDYSLMDAATGNYYTRTDGSIPVFATVEEAEHYRNHLADNLERWLFDHKKIPLRWLKEIKESSKN